MSDPSVSHSPYRDLAVPNVILVATDLEDDVDYLLPHAVAQARAASATLVLATVVPAAEGSALNTTALLPAEAEESAQEARRRLGNIASLMSNAGIPCEVVVRHGSPAEVVPALAREVGAARVIVGTHGRRSVKKLLLGSVADSILHKVEAPIYTIGPQASYAAPVGKPRRILHPVSLAPGYERSARLAIEMAQYYQAEIKLLHILPRDAQSRKDEEVLADWTRAELNRLIPEEAPLWIVSSVQVEKGTVVGKILDAANEMNADLIVLGVNPGQSFWAIGEDNTAYDIIVQAGCPVLTVRRTPGLRVGDELHGASRSIPVKAS
ncbi:MAG TPA: universal stress protein [Acidobacteriaceae bacterium]|nr:universal stress protein [Acidobacteriaceae bacterium]